MTLIKACPFCGAIDDLEIWVEETCAWVRCKACGADGPCYAADRTEKQGDKEQGALNLWNDEVRTPREQREYGA